MGRPCVGIGGREQEIECVRDVVVAVMVVDDGRGEMTGLAGSW